MSYIIKLLRNSHATIVDATLGSGMKASLIIPTYNRSLLLVECLKTALEQTYNSFEIIIVDQTFNVPETLCSLLKKNKDKIQYVRMMCANLPAARNEGIRRSSGEIAIFIDDDTKLPPGFIEAHMRNYVDPSIDAIAGAILGEDCVFTDNLVRDVRDHRLRHFSGTWNYDRRIDVMHGRGANHSFRRFLWDEVGGYDEQYTGTAFREDSDFFFRVHAAGYRIVYDPKTWLIHLPGPVPGGCWEGHDGIPSLNRIYNHAYFVLKNFQKNDAVPLMFKHLQRIVICREAVRSPWTIPRRFFRFASGWCGALVMRRYLRRSE